MDIDRPTHDGGCLCGAVRFRVVGEPRAVYACHCRFCQRLTGSAFNVEGAFPRERVVFDGAPCRTYDHRSPDHGRLLHVHACERCCTTVGLTTQRFPSFLVLAGTLDEPHWLRPSMHLFTAQAAPWVVFPDDVDCFEGHALALDGTRNVPWRTRAARPG
jgi:hypothetical protein